MHKPIAGAVWKEKDPRVQYNPDWFFPLTVIMTPSVLLFAILLQSLQEKHSQKSMANSSCYIWGKQLNNKHYLYRSWIKKHAVKDPCSGTCGLLKVSGLEWGRWCWKHAFLCTWVIVTPTHSHFTVHGVPQPFFGKAPTNYQRCAPEWGSISALSGASVSKEVNWPTGLDMLLEMSTFMPAWPTLRFPNTHHEAVCILQ